MVVIVVPIAVDITVWWFLCNNTGVHNSVIACLRIDMAAERMKASLICDVCVMSLTHMPQATGVSPVTHTVLHAQQCSVCAKNM